MRFKTDWLKVRSQVHCVPPATIKRLEFPPIRLCQGKPTSRWIFRHRFFAPATSGGPSRRRPTSALHPQQWCRPAALCTGQRSRAGGAARAANRCKGILAYLGTVGYRDATALVFASPGELASIKWN